jgi:hypothetical protein
MLLQQAAGTAEDKGNEDKGNDAGNEALTRGTLRKTRSPRRTQTMTKLLFAASAAALLSISGYAPAMAQSSMSMPMLSCKDISSMDK